jgi:hypothetical protein
VEMLRDRHASFIRSNLAGRPSRSGARAPVARGALRNGDLRPRDYGVGICGVGHFD